MGDFDVTVMASDLRRAVLPAGRCAAHALPGSPALVRIGADPRGSAFSVHGGGTSLGYGAQIDALQRTPSGLWVSAPALLRILKRIPEGTVQIVRDADGCWLRWRTFQARLEAHAALELVDGFAAVGSVDVGPSVLLSLLRQVASCMGSDRARPHMDGVKIEAEATAIRAVATDGHRLALARGVARFHGGQGHFGALVPSAAAKEIRLLAERAARCEAVGASESIGIAYDVEGYAGCLRVWYGHETLEIRCEHSNEFPPYSRIIPKDEAAVTVTARRAPLLAALRRVYPRQGRGKRAEAVHVVAEPGRLRLAHAPGEISEARDAVEVETSGSAVVHGIAGPYLIEALQSLESVDVDIGLRGPLEPWTVRPRVSGDLEAPTTIVIMPMRIS